MENFDPSPWTKTPEDVRHAIISPNGVTVVKEDWWEEALERGYQLCNVRPQSGSYCGFCNNLKPKELRKYDSCPECGKSLYARKQKPKGKF